VPIINSFQYNAALPKDWQWNGGVQIALPWQSAVDFEYVGHHAYDILSASGGASSVNINTIDLGTYVMPGTSMADGTLASGVGIDKTATISNPAIPPTLPNNLVRPIRGFQNININGNWYYRTFHSVQASFNRRFSHGFSFGVNWNWAFYDHSNALGVTGSTPNLRLNHNADGTYSVRADQATAVSMFSDQGDIKHIIKGNYVWQLPTVKSQESIWRVLGHVLNDWQLSGVYTFDTGAPYDLSYSYQNGGGTNLTGSPDFTARIVIPNLGIVGSGCSSDPYSQFNNKMALGGSNASFPLIASAFAGPQIGSVALDSGKNLFTACGTRNLDTAISRTIRLGGGRQIQFRWDVFNTLNYLQFNGRQTQLQLNSPSDMTVRNSEFLADGTIDPNRVKASNAGFGGATGAAALRSMQMQIRFMF
jgi:hypothetical protein